MQQVIRNARLQHSEQRFRYFRLPPLMIITLLLCAIFLSIILTVNVLAKHIGAPFLADPFDAYAHLFPGQLLNPHSLETTGYTCRLSPEPTPADVSEYCSRTLQTGPFSGVSVAMGDGTIMALHLVMQESRLTVDDLASRWGNPEIFRFKQWMAVRWYDSNVLRTGWIHIERSNHIQTLTQISFTLK